MSPVLGLQCLWSYANDDGKWILFNDVDQVYLEKSDNDIVAVHGGRCDVEKQKRIMRHVYTSTEVPVCRSSWFVGDVPYSEDDCEKISEWSDNKQSETNPLILPDNRQVYKTSDGKIMQSGTSLLSSSISVHKVSDACCPLKPPQANGDDPSVPADHLLICVHGIGESLWSKKAFNKQPFGTGVDTFRSLIGEYTGLDRKSRIEVLHVTWFHILHEFILNLKAEYFYVKIN